MNKPKPTVLKVLEGNRGHRPLNKNEPKPKKSKSSLPSWVNDEAKKEWNRLIPELERLGLLTTLDQASLIACCQCWGRFVEAEKYLKNNDTVFITENGYMQQVPQVGMAQKYLKLYLSFMAEFGLSPSSRTRINLSPDKPDESPMAKLWKQKKA